MALPLLATLSTNAFASSATPVTTTLLSATVMSMFSTPATRTAAAREGGREWTVGCLWCATLGTENPSAALGELWVHNLRRCASKVGLTLLAAGLLVHCVSSLSGGNEPSTFCKIRRTAPAQPSHIMST